MKKNPLIDKIVICDGPVDIKSYGLCIGVVFNKILKDLYAKFMKLVGYDVSYRMSWDLCNEYFNALVNKYGYEQTIIKARKIVQEHMKLFRELQISFKQNYTSVLEKNYDSYISMLLEKLSDDIYYDTDINGDLCLRLRLNGATDLYNNITEHRKNVKIRKAWYCEKCKRVYISERTLCQCGEKVRPIQYKLRALFESCCLIAEQMSDNPHVLNLVIEGKQEINLIMPFLTKITKDFQVQFYPHGNMVDENGKTLNIQNGNKICISTVMRKYDVDVIRMWCVLQSDKNEVSVTWKAFNDAKKEYDEIQALVVALLNKYSFKVFDNNIIQINLNDIMQGKKLIDIYLQLVKQAEKLLTSYKDERRVKLVLNSFNIILPNMIKKLRG